MHKLFYRKTERGMAEISRRSPGLQRSLRTLLILVAPQVSAAALAQRIGGDPLPMLAELVALGLIEPVVPTVIVPARQAAAATAPVRQPAPPPPPRAIDLRAAKLIALRELAPVFGPEVDTMLGGLLEAQTATALENELAALRETLVMYQGKRRADALIRRITDAS